MSGCVKSFDVCAYRVNLDVAAKLSGLQLDILHFRSNFAMKVFDRAVHFILSFYFELNAPIPDWKKRLFRSITTHDG
jgi:hypothetical protein